MLSIDRANVQLEPVSAGSGPVTAHPAGGEAQRSAHTWGMDDDAFRQRVLRVLEDVLREMDRRGSR